MEISSIKPAVDLLPQASQAPEDRVERRQLMQATNTVNESGILGRNQLVFMVDRATHRPIIRVENRDTHEVVLQLPPEYVLRLAEDSHSGSAQIMSLAADT
jgi:uncharacterized FlaG/YvyC family protein